jgi:hypothetical protein
MPPAETFAAVGDKVIVTSDGRIIAVVVLEVVPLEVVSVATIGTVLGLGTV